MDRRRRVRRPGRRRRPPPGRGLRPIALLVDTGVLYAAANRRDADHERCAALVRTAEPPLIVPALVVAEAAYMIGTFVGSATEAGFFRGLATARYRVEPLTGADVTRIADLVTTYADLPLGGVDASVIATAERLGLDTVATLDRRHFSVVRPAHAEALTIVP